MNPLPPSLSSREATGIHPGVPVAQWELGPAKNFVYLLVDWTARAAAVVDPQADRTPLLAALRTHGLQLTHVLLTHTHWDHVAGLWDVLAENPACTAHVHALERHRLEPHPASARVQTVHDGDVLEVGALRVTVLHTPGHSAGECCFLVTESPPLLFTGDTLFIRDCGRTDLPTGDTAQMFASLQRLKGLDPATLILPGHHYAPETASVLARELVDSGPLRVTSVAELGRLP